MSQIAELIGYFTLIFALSVGAGYLFTALRKPKASRYEPSPDSKVRIRTAGNVYRARFQAASDKGWVLSAPIGRDTYVPIRVGESVIVEAVCKDGVGLFRTQVIERTANPHTITVGKPPKVEVVDRRSVARLSTPSELGLTLNGMPVELVDISESGAHVAMEKGLRLRAVVVLASTSGLSDVRGSVIDCRGYDDGGARRYSVRIQFDEPIDIPKSLRQATIR